MSPQPDTQQVPIPRATTAAWLVLPPRTKVYCTHEYTLANAKFALTAEPHNTAIQERYQHVETLRLLNQITLPSTIQQELETNPFLRVSNAHEFQKLREWKDNF